MVGHDSVHGMLGGAATGVASMSVYRHGRARAHDPVRTRHGHDRAGGDSADRRPDGHPVLRGGRHVAARAPGPPRDRVTRLLPKGKPTRGILVRNEDGAVALELYVVVEDGLNLAEVVATVRSQVAYEVERQTGLAVVSVDVHIQDLKRSA
jgi:hypothetical protein